MTEDHYLQALAEALEGDDEAARVVAQWLSS